MNFKSRIKSIEGKLSFQLHGIEESELLNPNYKFKGNPFNRIDEMITALNVVEPSPYYSDDQIIQFSMNGLLSFESEEMQKIRIKAFEEMTRML